MALINKLGIVNHQQYSSSCMKLSEVDISLKHHVNDVLKHPHQPQCKYIDGHHQEKSSKHCDESKFALINQFSNLPALILSTSYQDSQLVFHSLGVHYFLGRWNPNIVCVCRAGPNARDVFS